jgi:CDP-glucose 4,6-dehydratase
VLELVRHILRIAGRPDLTPIVLGEATAEIPMQYLGAAKAREMLSWSPGWTTDEALRETVAWYRAWFAKSAADPAPAP